MKKSLVAVLVVAIVAAAAVWYFTRPKADADQFTLYGNVDIRQVSLAFEGSDRVAEMRVQEGDPVKAGQVLALLDTRVLTLQAAQSEAQIGVQEQALLKLHNGSRPEEIAQARAQVAAAQADADLATQQLTRLQGIAASTGGKGVSQQDMDSAASKVRNTQAQLDNRRKALQLQQVGPRKEDIGQAEAQLNVSRAELALLKHHIAQAELKAPQDAVVRARLLEPGDMASPQRPAYTLAITDPKWVRVYVTEPQLGLLKPGQGARVTTDSHPDQPIEGQVGYISSVAEFTPKNVETKDLRTSLVYEVRVLVKDPQNRLRLGMPATVRIDAKADANPPKAAK
ncbi:MAG TPA: HlyD family efflux transporter periplasmic adaptor subunit [Burkholderiales bacterium]|nr:HlyD family efflux transporter periplasmic adaptor subunit [Burkholderiales bacterium]